MTFCETLTYGKQIALMLNYTVSPGLGDTLMKRPFSNEVEEYLFKLGAHHSKSVHLINKKFQASCLSGSKLDSQKIGMLKDIG
jgi:hypothetical protein